MKFYPSDWRADPALRACTIAARGLWIEMLCIMHEADPYGSLLVKGRRIDKKQLASLCGIPERECTVLMLELEGFGVYERDLDGTIYSRRMRRDFAKAVEDKNNGTGGGNPKLKGKDKAGVNPPDNPGDNAEDKAQRPETRFVVAGDAREPLISKAAFDLADRLLVIAGHSLEAVPPGWCGAPMRVQTWLSQGWGPEIIEMAVTSAARKKRGAPANSVQFFENAIAEEVARQAAPLPVVEIRAAENIKVTHDVQKTDNLSAVARGIAEGGISFGERPSASILRSVPSGDNVRMLPKSGGE